MQISLVVVRGDAFSRDDNDLTPSASSSRLQLERKSKSACWFKLSDLVAELNIDDWILCRETAGQHVRCWSMHTTGRVSLRHWPAKIAQGDELEETYPVLVAVDDHQAVELVQPQSAGKMEQ
jgi:hypothetical protein